MDATVRLHNEFAHVPQDTLVTISFPGNRSIQVWKRHIVAFSDKYVRNMSYVSENAIMKPSKDQNERKETWPVIIRVNLSNQTFNDFQQLCQGEAVTLCDSNFDELHLLAKELEIGNLLERCILFEKEYFDEKQEPLELGKRVLGAIKHRIELQIPTEDLEKLLCERLEKFAGEISSLLELVGDIGVSVFARVFALNNGELLRKHNKGLDKFLCVLGNSFPDWIPLLPLDGIEQWPKKKRCDLWQFESMRAYLFKGLERDIFRVTCWIISLAALSVLGVCLLMWTNNRYHKLSNENMLTIADEVIRTVDASSENIQELKGLIRDCQELKDMRRDVQELKGLIRDVLGERNATNQVINQTVTRISRRIDKLENLLKELQVNMPNKNDQTGQGTGGIKEVALRIASFLGYTLCQFTVFIVCILVMDFLARR